MPRLTSIGSAFRQFKRYRQIVGILVKYGFGQIMDQFRLWRHINIECRIMHRCEREISHLERGERVRLAIQELGPTFIKIGQILSTRPDMVPPDIVKELEKLQEHVPPFPGQVAREVVQSELGRPIEDVFMSFDNEPIAAASLAQVHRARLKGGNEVVTKIRRPDITKVIEVDMEIMHTLANLMEHHVEEAKLLNPVALVDEIHADIKKELNFRAEANNLVRFAQNFADDPQIRMPKVYEELCTPRLLVMEYIDGINISQIERLSDEGYDLELLAKRGADVLFKSALEYGFFHADPHPGNIFVLPDNVLCLLDFGMMGTLSSLERSSVAKMTYGIVTRDEKVTTRALLDLAVPEGDVFEEQLQMDLSRYIQEFAYLPFSQLRLGEMMQGEIQILRAHRLRFPTNLVWFLKAIATMEDLTRRLNPETNMAEYVRPHAEQMLRRRFSPVQEARDLAATAMDFLDLIKELPYETRSTLRRLREGRLKMEVEQKGQETMRKTFDRMANRLSVAMIIAALLIGSSLLVLSELPPLVGGINVIGLAGFIIAVILGALLEIAIFRSRNS